MRHKKCFGREPRTNTKKININIENEPYIRPAYRSATPPTDNPIKKRYSKTSIVRRSKYG
jgi:hypothetical protein